MPKTVTDLDYSLKYCQLYLELFLLLSGAIYVVNSQKYLRQDYQFSERYIIDEFIAEMAGYARSRRSVARFVRGFRFLGEPPSLELRAD
jgi:hypothetical protein